MSVGLAELDDDHKALIRIINQLSADLDAGDRRTAVGQSLRRLKRYAQYHFGREEAVMVACGYSTLAAHQDEHRDFIDQIQALTDRLDAAEGDPAGLGPALLDFLVGWLQHHILIVDMTYRPCVEGKAEAHRAAKGFKAAEIWWDS
jgi:hemerythrin-like metal-binding protein